MTTKTFKTADLNLDPLSGTPGAHPIGTGLGAAGAGAAGAAIGAVVGPAGALAGAAVGAIVGGLAGKGVAEMIDPTAEEAYWRDSHMDTPYYDATYEYETDYLPAYQHGWQSRAKYTGKSWDEVERDVEKNWDSNRSGSRLGWDKAKLATRDAWDRIESSIPDDSNRNAK